MKVGRASALLSLVSECQLLRASPLALHVSRSDRTVRRQNAGATSDVDVPTADSLALCEHFGGLNRRRQNGEECTRVFDVGEIHHARETVRRAGVAYVDASVAIRRGCREVGAITHREHNVTGFTSEADTVLGHVLAIDLARDLDNPEPHVTDPFDYHRIT